jgi:magnesium-transporting ATPase (P-type)
MRDSILRVRSRNVHAVQSMKSPGHDAPEANHAPHATAWHALDIERVLQQVAGTSRGLDDGDAAARLVRWGANRPDVPLAEPAWRMLARQFASVVVALLIAATGLALLMREWANAGVIAAVLVLDVGLGFGTEWRARRAIDALLALQAPRATLLRAGHRREVDSAGVVPGDVLVLEAGMTVSADARLLRTTELRLAEALLTGESVPVGKRAAPAADLTAPLAERATMVYAGTSVADGTGRAVVVETGARTELGRVGALVSSVATERSPLERRLDVLGRNLGGVAVGVAALVGGVAWWHGVAPAAVATLFIAVAVAAIPEGLPAVVTIAMAVGAQRMARRHAIVRRLPAVESLGAVSVVCTDKTGTLTLGEMTVTTIWAADTEYAVSGVGYGATGDVRRTGIVHRADDDPALARVLGAAMLANRAALRIEGTQRVAVGDPTEAALLVAAEKAGLDRAALLDDAPEVAELPFSSDRMLMATVHRPRDSRSSNATQNALGESRSPSLRGLVKGAPVRVLARCAIDDGERTRLLAVNDRLASRGLRVLAVAEVDLPAATVPSGVAGLEAVLTGLTLLGFIGMTDPPAPRVQETIDTLRQAGIRTLMVTGDQRATAAAVGETLGVVSKAFTALDGDALDAMSDPELGARLAHAGVISRVSPEGKLRVVRALRAAGHIVAMLGDGVNDAPALRQADVGVAMGRRGTDAAREAAGVVLEDDRFETIGAAVEEGRRIFDNIRRVVLYLLAGNLAELIVILGGTVMGTMLLTPLQILWINLVTDSLPALALAVEPAAPDIMRRPPRRATESLLPAQLALYAGAYAVVVAGATYVAYVIGGGGSTLAAPGTGPDPERGRAFAFMILVLAQLSLVLLVRAPRAPARLALSSGVQSGRSYTTIAFIATAALQLALALVPGVAPALGLSNLGGSGFATVFLLTTATLVVLLGVRRLVAPSARLTAAAPVTSEV